MVYTNRVAAFRRFAYIYLKIKNKKKIKIYYFKRALSLIGRASNCRLGLSQFESRRARYFKYNLIKFINTYAPLR